MLVGDTIRIDVMPHIPHKLFQTNAVYISHYWLTAFPPSYYGEPNSSAELAATAMGHILKVHDFTSIPSSCSFFRS